MISEERSPESPGFSDREAMDHNRLIRSAADDYLSSGWFVFPVSPVNEKLTGKHRELSGKLPASIRYYLKPIGSPMDICKHFPPGVEIGIETGRCSNIVVLDVDTEEAQEKVRQLDLPETRMVKTRNGQHLYFRHPGPEYFLPSNHALLWQGIDVKGENGFVTLPPSRHPEGGHYCWIDPDVPIADLPQSLLNRLLALPHRSRWTMVRRYLYRKYLRHPLNSLTGW